MFPRTVLTTALLLTACGAEPRAVTGDDPDVARIAAENNAFTLDVHRAVVAEQGGNVFTSPFSMNAALSMTYAGARGQTAQEMEQVLHMLDGAEHHAPLGALMRDLNEAERRAYTLDVANRIWGDQSKTWSPDFLDLNEDVYGAPTVLRDIQGDPEGTRSEINDWVSDVTRDKIPELLEPGVINASTVMVLVNAIYFKADWAEAFEEENTRPTPFERAEGSTVDVDTMHATLDGRFATGEGYTAAGLAYGEEAEVRMWVLLPDPDSDLASLEASLDAGSLASTLDQAGTTELSIALPKFELRTKAALKPTLSELGMPTAFTPSADFGGMVADAPEGPVGIYIDEVIHEAYVRVDEEGTEAAAATAVVTRELSASPTQPFTVDRPFLFLIRDELTGSILFIGRVTDPSASSSPE